MEANSNLAKFLGCVIVGIEIAVMIGNYRNGRRVAKAEERIANILDDSKVKIGKHWYDDKTLH